MYVCMYVCSQMFLDLVSHRFLHTKCVILSTPLKWGSHINLHRVKAVLHEAIFPATCNAMLTIRKNCKLLVRCQT